MKVIEIPRRIDEPPHLLLWSIDEIAPIMIGLLLGVMFKQQIIMIGVGLILAKVYKKFRDNHPDGFFIHLLYWKGFMPSGSKTFINPYIRRLFP